MPQKMETEFAFEVGQIVYFRTSLNTYDHIPKPFLVISQIAERCPANCVQRSYRLQGVDGFVTEVALSAEAPPYDNRSESWHP